MHGRGNSSGEVKDYEFTSFQMSDMMEGEHDFTIANAYKNMTVTPYSAPKNHLEVIGTKYFKP